MKFRFKQFEVSNERSAMKIGTDGVLLGAWTDVGYGPRRVLDVGAGTGLLALMLAQRLPEALITAIEIEPSAASEARENAAASPWGNRIEVTNADFTTANLPPEAFDLIISNPPFFNSELRSPSASRADARHEGTLSYESLLSAASTLLSPSGSVAFISPCDREDDIEWLLTLNKLSLYRKTFVATVPGKALKRILWQATVGDAHGSLDVTTLTIADSEGRRSPEFAFLTREFYL